MEFLKRFFPVFVFSLCLIANASAQKVEEEDLSFDFLKWHYVKYPGAEAKQWTKIKKDGADFVYVEFSFEGQDYSVTYTADGQRTKERVKYAKKDIPSSASEFLGEKFAGEKFKVDEFEQLNLFEGSKQIDSFYLMEVKVNKDEYILYFDDNLGHIKSPSPQLLSSL